MKRLEQGSSMAEVARSCKVSSNLLNRWRHELRNLGPKAFSSNGKSPNSISPRIHNIVFRLTEEEFDHLKTASSAEGSRSLSDFVRSQTLRASGEPAMVKVDKKLDELNRAVQQILEIVTKK